MSTPHCVTKEAESDWGSIVCRCGPEKDASSSLMSECLRLMFVPVVRLSFFLGLRTRSLLLWCFEAVVRLSCSVLLFLIWLGTTQFGACLKLPRSTMRKRRAFARRTEAFLRPRISTAMSFAPSKRSLQIRCCICGKLEMLPMLHPQHELCQRSICRVRNNVGSLLSFLAKLKPAEPTCFGFLPFSCCFTVRRVLCCAILRRAVCLLGRRSWATCPCQESLFSRLHLTMQILRPSLI